MSAEPTPREAADGPMLYARGAGKARGDLCDACGEPLNNDPTAEYTIDTQVHGDCADEIRRIRNLRELTE